MNNDKDKNEQDKKDDPHASNLLEDKKPIETPQVPSLSEVGSINEQADKYYKAPENTGEGAPTAVAVEPETIPPGEVRKKAGEPPTEAEQRGDEMRKEMKEGVDQGQQDQEQKQGGQAQAQSADPDELEEQIDEAEDNDEFKPTHRGKPSTTLPGKRKK